MGQRVKLIQQVKHRLQRDRILSSVLAFMITRRLQIHLENCTHGEDQVKVLFEHYGSELPAETVVGDEFLIPAVIILSSDLPTEWKIFRRYITNQSREDIKDQLKELSTNSMMQTT